MISAFANSWRITELRHRILYTLALIVIIRLGVHITLPGVDGTVIDEWLQKVQASGAKDSGNSLGALLTVFSGGGLQQAGILALGIMPYISASIMVQLMTAIVPQVARLSREDGGREKISMWTRLLALVIGAFQGAFLAHSLATPGGMSHLMPGIEKVSRPLVADPSWVWYSIVVLTILAGTMLMLWIADQITEKGIGNGTSIIIVVNIISALPGAMVQAWKFFTQDGSGLNAVMMVVMLLLMVVVVAATIALTQAQRRIAVQYAKRVIGRKQFGGQTQYLPLKLNYAGVMPVIFATAILSLPAILLKMIPWVKDQHWAVTWSEYFTSHGAVYHIVGAIGIFLFSYFWVAMMFQPSQIAEDLKRNGGYVPGVRPGKPTADFLDFTMTRLTFAGALFLAILFALPIVTGAIIGLPSTSMVLQFCGGTSLLIMVGVVLDIMRQVETQLIQKNYDGFLRKGKTRARYDRLAQSGEASSGRGLVLLWVVIALIILACGIITAAKHIN